jgi:hypothetical protein
MNPDYDPSKPHHARDGFRNSGHAAQDARRVLPLAARTARAGGAAAADGPVGRRAGEFVTLRHGESLTLEPALR